MEKYIITSGCSYSDVSMGAWPKHIDEFFPNVIVKNYGSCARGNDYISRTIISSVQKLLDEGIYIADNIGPYCAGLFTFKDT